MQVEHFSIIGILCVLCSDYTVLPLVVTIC